MITTRGNASARSRTRMDIIQALAYVRILKCRVEDLVDEREAS